MTNFKEAWKGKSPYLRKIEKDEIIIEHDHCTREEGLQLAELTLQKIGRMFRAEVWDHEGKSPHIHIRKMQGLGELTEKQRRLYKIAFIRKYAGNPDKADISLAQKSHLIAKEDQPHWKIAHGKKYGIKKLVKIVNDELVNVLEDELPIRDLNASNNDLGTGIIGLAKSHGVTLNEQGQSLCVFHHELNPSLTFYPETNTAYCFGCHTFCTYESLKKHLEDKYYPDTGLLEDKDLFGTLIREISKKVAGDDKSARFILLSIGSIYVRNINQKPNLMVSSQSSSGKSYITKCVCELFSLTGRIEMYSKITPQALSYLHAEDKNFTWDGKLLYIEDAQTQLLNSETFKVFVSEGLEKTATVKDQESKVVSIKGKPTIFTTTANVDLSDEMSNRFIVVGIDESLEQTVKVLNHQSKLFTNTKKATYDKNIMLGLKGLKDVNVIIPYAELIAPQFHMDLQRVKRDYSRFLGLIQSHAALYQIQRETDEEGNIIANEEDYEIIRKLYQEKVLDNVGFFGLSHREQKALDYCINYINLHGPFYASQIQAKNPTATLPTWKKWLDKFVTNKLLVTNYVQDGMRHYTEYSKGVNSRILLKPLAELREATKATKQQIEVQRKFSENPQNEEKNLQTL